MKRKRQARNCEFGYKLLIDCHGWCAHEEDRLSFDGSKFSEPSIAIHKEAGKVDIGRIKRTWDIETRNSLMYLRIRDRDESFQNILRHIVCTLLDPEWYKCLHKMVGRNHDSGMDALNPSSKISIFRLPWEDRVSVKGGERLEFLERGPFFARTSGQKRNEHPTMRRSVTVASFNSSTVWYPFLNAEEAFSQIQLWMKRFIHPKTRRNRR